MNYFYTNKEIRKQKLSEMEKKARIHINKKRIVLNIDSTVKEIKNGIIKFVAIFEEFRNK